MLKYHPFTCEEKKLFKNSLCILSFRFSKINLLNSAAFQNKLSKIWDCENIIILTFISVCNIENCRSKNFSYTIHKIFIKVQLWNIKFFNLCTWHFKMRQPSDLCKINQMLQTTIINLYFWIYYGLTWSKASKLTHFKDLLLKICHLIFIYNMFKPQIEYILSISESVIYWQNVCSNFKQFVIKNRKRNQRWFIMKQE